MNQSLVTDPNQLLAWAKANLDAKRDLEQTAGKLAEALAKLDLNPFGRGLFNYYLALAYAFTGQHSQAVLAFQNAINGVIGDGGFFHEVLAKFILYMEQINMLEYALMLCNRGLELYPGHPELSASRERLLAAQLEAPYQAQSNLQHWQELQAQGYFEQHVHYQAGQGLIEGGNDLEIIARAHRLGPDQQVVVIGCGYGRESAMIASRVRLVWGIDVSEGILAKASSYLAAKGLDNFRPVLAESWRETIPAGIDLAYCYTVFQHLTKFLVQDYVTGLAEKLVPGGSLICQFMHSVTGSHDARLSTYEPHVSWSKPEIAQLFERAGLEFKELEDVLAVPDEEIWWYWVSGSKPAAER